MGDTNGHYLANETEISRRSPTFNVDQYRLDFGPQFWFCKVKNITPYFHLVLRVAHTSLDLEDHDVLDRETNIELG